MATYIHGNTVRKEATLAIGEQSRQQKPVSHQVKNNRSKALHVSKGYVAFLAIAAVVALCVCVKYLQLQSEVTKRSKNIVVMQQQLSDMKEDNVAKQDSIMNSVNLDQVREKAIHELGMVYASSEQIILYKNPVGNEVTQYSMIPESGVLASAAKVN